jgi:hypothetical protein
LLSQTQTRAGITTTLFAPLSRPEQARHPTGRGGVVLRAETGAKRSESVWVDAVAAPVADGAVDHEPSIL